MFKSGFVTILGEPNVGKSTLLNALINEKLSIVTPKAQTTRRTIKGILSTENYQIIFVDTPGILKPEYKLHKSMLFEIDESIKDTDVILYLTTINHKINEKAKSILQKSNVPFIVAINKIDLEKSNEKIELLKNLIKEELNTENIIPISALNRINLDILIEKILDFLQEHPPYYDLNDLSDSNLRFFVAEFIREKIFLTCKQEVPYSTEVVVTDFKEEEKITKIYATIYVMRESQKKIIIGEGGKMIKKIGTLARQDIERFLNCKVYLELKVKVLENWRNNENYLRFLGYRLK